MNKATAEGMLSFLKENHLEEESAGIARVSVCEIIKLRNTVRSSNQQNLRELKVRTLINKRATKTTVANWIKRSKFIWERPFVCEGSRQVLGRHL
ncbi:hypothetical protein CEXT_493331 [Caerostris extrusa]|uniref:Uncharacterized protein n=1 Tax=Caerostris extrusa TaxID=172846 RepID=A0AAV4XUD3_CAEEX|nr:hypothetical protein CEXT_493331 [Caerostris extrusa]